MSRRSALAITLTAVALALAACGTGAGTGSPESPGVATPASASEAPPASAAASAPASAGTATCTVTEGGIGTPATIKGFAFPAGATVMTGEAITWSNDDSVPHTVTFSDGTCDSGTIAGGSAVTVTYTVAGTYPFTCRIHPNMAGTLEVAG